MPTEQRIREQEGFVKRSAMRLARIEELPPTALGKDRLLWSATNTLRKHKRTLRKFQERRD